LSSHPRDDLIIVDLDETLWLRNSTEAFLDHARPRLLVASLLALIDALRPWRWAGDGSPARAAFIWRDWLRTTLTLLLTPWNYWRWRRDAPTLARAASNEPLLALLKRHDGGRRERGRIVVASHGFVPIVRPVVNGLMRDVPLVASSLVIGWRQRAAGKWASLVSRFDMAELRRALFLTDHEDHDADVLREIGRPVVMRWPLARFEPACERAYAPFRYTLQGKHAGRNHLVRVFLGMDWLALVFASAPAVAAPLIATLAYLFLMLSFFVIFEIGYHENDALGAEREEAPRLTDARKRALGTMVEAEAWCAAIFFAVPGLILLAMHEVSVWAIGGVWLIEAAWLLALWLALLVMMRGLFAIFNRVDETSRTFLYLPLQATKGIGIVLMLGLPATLVGLALLIAQAIARWMAYVAYRTSGVWRQTPDRLHRLILLTIVFLAMLPTVEVTTLSPWPIALVFGWCLLQARHEIGRAWRLAYWLGAQAPPKHGRRALDDPQRATQDGPQS
jgi:hypothetical protein